MDSDPTESPRPVTSLSTPGPQNVPQIALLDPSLQVARAVEVGFETWGWGYVTAGRNKPAGHSMPVAHR